MKPRQRKSWFTKSNRRNPGHRFFPAEFEHLKRPSVFIDHGCELVSHQMRMLFDSAAAKDAVRCRQTLAWGITGTYSCLEISFNYRSPSAPLLFYLPLPGGPRSDSAPVWPGEIPNAFFKLQDASRMHGSCDTRSDGVRRYRVTHRESESVPRILIKYWTGQDNSSDRKRAK
jgi:hypothetical protein